MGDIDMEGSDRRSRAPLHRLVSWLAGAVAGCPGLEEVCTEPDGRRSDAPGSGREAEEPSEGGTEGQQRDLVSLRDRIGLGCSLIPGCGGGIVVLVPFAVASVLALGQTGVSTGADSEPTARFVRVDLPANPIAGTTLTDIAVGDAGWVIVGWEDADGSPKPRVLHSDDGVSWSLGRLPARPEGGLLAQVAAHDDGFVATGMPGALWVSADGVSWQVHELEAPLDSSYFHDLTVHEGTLYAVGCVYLEEQSCSDIGVWRSDDFATMVPLPLPDGMAFVPYGVAVDDRGLVITGFGWRNEEGVDEGSIAWTGDEQSWETTSLGPDTRLVAVEVGSEGFVAVGTRDGRVLAVSSTDGVTWTDVADADPRGFAMSVDPGPPILVAGSDTTDDGWHGPAMWRHEPGGGLGSLTLEGLGPRQQGDVRGLAVTAGGAAMALGSVHAGDSEEAVLWRLETD
jgi:hypothetical protein